MILQLLLSLRWRIFKNASNGLATDTSSHSEHGLQFFIGGVGKTAK